VCILYAGAFLNQRCSFAQEPEPLTDGYYFLPKPFDDEELLKAVAQALNKSQREQNERTEVAEIRRRLSSLTPREREVLCHVVAGQLNKQTAADLRGCLKSHDLVNRLSMRRIAIRSISVSEVCTRCS